LSARPSSGPLGESQSTATTAKPSVPAQTGFAVESYYRIKWGLEEEFLELWRKNHLPFLQRMRDKGVVSEVRMDKPREHLPEEHRWDLRVTVVYRDASAAYSPDKITEADYGDIIKGLQGEATFKKEEQRRFEILLAHWDVNVERTETLVAR
jgi:hypothetical protein